MVKQEWKRLIHNPVLIIVLLAIILIPSIYAGFFLASMWDPYGELDKLPVAVVNLDESYKYEGKDLTIGDDLVSKLKEDKSLDFRFVDSNEAESGLRSGKYYMVVTIPSDFSKNAASVMDNDPQKMLLKYETNPATNYVAMKLSESAMTKIQMSLQEKVTETYTKAIFDKLSDIGTGFSDAADGASKIYDGENDLTSGVDKLNDGANKLADGAAALSEGANKVNNGAVALNNGIKDYLDGTTKVYNGSLDLVNGMNALGSGANDLASGADKLSNGTAALAKGASDLSSGTSQLSNGAQNLAGGTARLASGASDLSKGARTLSAGMNSLASQAPQLASGVASIADGAGNLNTGITNYTNGVASAYEGAAGLSDGLDKLNTGFAGITSSSSQINTSIENIAGMAAEIAKNSDDPSVQALAGALAQLKTNNAKFNTTLASVSGSVATLDKGAASLESGLATLNKNSQALVTGSKSLSDGANALNQSVPALVSGIEQLSNGASALSSGADDLSSGAKEVNTGAATVAGAASQLNSGASTLSSGITQVNEGAAALSDGANKLSQGTASAIDGANKLSNGTGTLVANNDKLMNGASDLADGTSALAKGTNSLVTGSNQLADGTGTLKSSMPKLTDGTNELYEALADGADKIKNTNKNDANAEMFSSPVTLEETKITTVNDNGHAMAAYMMSVGLWVASLAFCLMYPLTKHDGITSGFKWWLSKASVLYSMAIIQALILVGVLHFTLGFEPARIGQTIFVACLTSVAFMSIMYYFNVLMGKVGSFIMLIFMVLQLAGSAGTYPIEVSGSLAQGLNRFMPFTYTVQAFRSAIGGGEPFPVAVGVLLAIFLVSSALTVILFLIRGRKEANGKRNLYQWMEEKGFA